MTTKLRLHTENIKARIAAIKPAYSPEDVHFELLIRSATFKAEWEAEMRPRRAAWGADIERLCRRWGLDPKAASRPVEDLRPFINLSPDIISRDHEGRVVMKPMRGGPGAEINWLGRSWPEYVQVEGPFLYVRVNRWSRFPAGELKKKIEDAQQWLWGTLPTAPSQFGPHLCWWDLHTRPDLGERTEGEIRNDWKLYRGEDAKIPRIRSGLGSIEGAINSL